MKSFWEVVSSAGGLQSPRVWIAPACLARDYYPDKVIQSARDSNTHKGSARLLWPSQQGNTRWRWNLLPLENHRTAMPFIVAMLYNKDTITIILLRVIYIVYLFPMVFVLRGKGRSDKKNINSVSAFSSCICYII